MYTRCPSCRAEISFEPPANAENLPDGYKHRIKCPSCGVTIGVKIPRVDATATVQPTYRPQNAAATSFEPVYQGYSTTPYAPAKTALPAMEKKSGISRNVFMMLMSLIFIALSAVSYLASAGKIPLPEAIALGFAQFNGIGMWEAVIKNTASVGALFEASVFAGITAISPLIVFTLAGITFIVAFIAACGRKYGRAFNMIISLITAAAACLGMFYIFACSDGLFTIGEYFTSYLFTIDNCILIVIAGLGIIQFIFSLIFLKSLRKKRS